MAIKKLEALLYGTLAFGAFALYLETFLHKKSSFTESGVTWSYESNHGFPYVRPFCVASLSDGELTKRLIDKRCDGSIDIYHSVKIKSGEKILEIYAWRTEETEPEFRDHDEFFEYTKKTVKAEAGKN